MNLLKPAFGNMTLRTKWCRLFIFVMESHYVDQASLAFLLYPPHECWDYKSGPIFRLNHCLYCLNTYCVCCVCAHVPKHACGGQKAGVGSTLTPLGPQVVNSGPQAW